MFSSTDTFFTFFIHKHLPSKSVLNHVLLRSAICQVLRFFVITSLPLHVLIASKPLLAECSHDYASIRAFPTEFILYHSIILASIHCTEQISTLLAICREHFNSTTKEYHHFLLFLILVLFFSSQYFNTDFLLITFYLFHLCSRLYCSRKDFQDNYVSSSFESIFPGTLSYSSIQTFFKYFIL